MWKCVCDETETCIWWREYTYLIMWKCVCDDVNVHIWWREYTYLIMLGYGHDESVPYTWRNVRTPFRGWALVFHGMFVGISRNVCWYFAECFVCISLVFVGFSRCVRCIIADRQQHFRKPFAAVGVRFIAPAYTYTPTKWQTVMCVWWCGNVYLIMWKHVFDNVDMLERFTINRRIP